MTTTALRAAWLVAFALAASSAVAQPGQNIAGNYRGLMTSCLNHARSADCRRSFVELIRLADEVDAQRIVWERMDTAGSEAASGRRKAYEEAVDRLNRAVADFNRGMTRSAGGEK